MGKIFYEIGRVNHSNYFLNIEKEILWKKKEIHKELFYVPFLDLLNAFRGDKINDLFMDFILRNYTYSEIMREKEYLSSFTYLFLQAISASTNGNNDLLKHNLFTGTNNKKNSPVIPKFDLNQRNERRNFILYLHSNFKECNINLVISNKGILKSTTQEHLTEIKNELLNIIIDDCELILGDMVGKFDKVLLHKNCIQRSRDKQIENQSLEIRNKKIRGYLESIVTEVLHKNPDLKNPNIINVCDKSLVQYLYYFQSLSRSLSGLEIFEFEKGNVFCPKSKSNEMYYYTIRLDSQIETLNNKLYFKINACSTFFHSYNYYNYFVLDINTPFVKQVLLDNSSQSIQLELRNCEDERQLIRDAEYIPVLNEDRIPCLLETKLFNKYEIDNTLIFSINEIIREITNKIDFLKVITEEILQKKYINDFLNNKYSESNFTTELKKVRQANLIILQNFHHQKLLSYFFHQLFHNYQRDFIIISDSHQFVIQDTKKQENEELGRRTEWLVNRFLKNFIEEDKWYFEIDKEELVKKSSNYPNYPYDTIPICGIIWNNQGLESFKPYDFSINFGNTLYKIEVKSTRGDEENVFYISIKELEELLVHPEQYFILRLSYIKQFEKYYGIQFNDEFYGKFYKIKPETLYLVKKKLAEWKEYYKTDSIRFTVDQFELIPDTYNENLMPFLYVEPSIMNSRYWDKYEDFIQSNYFNELERILESYSDIIEVSNLKRDLKKLKKQNRFHFVEKLSNEEVVIPAEVPDLNVDKGASTSLFEDDLPF